MRICSLVRAVIAGLSLAGLIAGELAPAAASDPVTIEFAAWQFTEKGRGEKLSAMVDKFMADHPDIKVEKVATPYPQFQQTIFTQAGQGSGPDVFVIGDDGFSKAVDAGFFEPLGGLMDLSSLKLTPVNKSGVVNDKQYALIWGANTYNLIYNKDILASVNAKVPTTYEEFLNVAARLHDAGIFAYAFRTTSAEATGMWYDVSNWVYGLGGRWSKAGKPLFDSEPVVTAIDRLQKLYAAGYVPKGADFATYRRMFWEGKVAMFIDNLAVPGVVVAGNPEMRDKIGIAPNPFKFGDHAAITIYIGINANSKHKQAAAQFMNYLFSPDGQAALYDVLGGVSVGTDIDLSHNPLTERAPWLVDAAKAVAVQTAVSPVPEGLAAQATELNAILAELLEQVLFGGTRAADAMHDAQQRALEAAAHTNRPQK